MAKILISIVFTGLLSLQWLGVVRAEEDSEPPTDAVTLPLGTLQIGEHSAPIPDWRLISFDDFPPFLSDGEWGEVEWEAGDKITDHLTLGDFPESELHLLTVGAIGNKLGINYEGELKTLSLDKFELLKRQTLASLVEALPALSHQVLVEVSLIKDLVLGVEPTLLISQNVTVGEFLRQFPEYGEISLIHLTLQNYQLRDLPGIERVPLQAFKDWQDATISEVPLLEYMSLWALPNPPNLDGDIAVASIEAESGDSVQLNAVVANKRPILWALGAMTPGGIGSGSLSDINDGQELSGATPYGSLFKVVPHQITSDGLETAIYFRTCRQSAGRESLDCSPYGIGPIPFMHYGEAETLFLGHAGFQSATQPDLPPPTPEAEASPKMAEEPLNNEGLGKRAKGVLGILALLSLGSGIFWMTQVFKPNSPRSATKEEMRHGAK